MVAPRLHDRDKLVPEICDRLAQGEPLAVICRDIGISRRTVNQWRQDDADIDAQFDEARDLGFDAIAHECLTIANTPELGVVEKLEPMKMPDGQLELVVTERRKEDMLAHRKLKIETRLKLLAKWDPRRYGDKQTLEHTGPNGGPIQQIATQVDDPVQAAEIYKKVMAGEG